MKIKCLPLLLMLLAIQVNAQHKSYSGIYPHLAMYNNEGECGTGAVVPWAGKLWVITYGPHLPLGSSDKLYEISNDLTQVIRPESVGGTPANRLIHKESNQLNIGPYFINLKGDIRLIPSDVAPGRFTGSARHIFDPANKIYIATMEEGFYEVDVNNLNVMELYKDGNNSKTGHKNPNNDLLPGAHGKGLYSGQGVLIFSNNGEATEDAKKKFNVTSGSLSEWNGKDWKVIRRNQFTEVTGPGGIYGNTQPEIDPIWAVGWDYKSILLGVRYDNKWMFYRLPKASNSYDGAHGWNTEWPRIRNVGTDSNPDYLMTMHGMFWKFPETFTPNSSAGIRPRSAYLKIIGDFTRWLDKLVFGCDDSAQNEFLNTRSVKGEISGPGQSNSNLWFLSPDQLDHFGPTNATGAVYLNDEVKANQASDPFLFAGWENRCVWIKSESTKSVKFTFEVDKSGNNNWISIKTVVLQPYSSLFIPFERDDSGEWVRIVTDNDTKASVVFSYGANENRSKTPDKIFNGLATVGQVATNGGILYPLGNNRRGLGILANNEKRDIGYFEVDSTMTINPKNDPEIASYILNKMSIPKRAIKIDNGSVLIIDDSNRRWRLPLGNEKLNEPTLKGKLRVCREVATERDLFNCLGTFYELPAENADGFAKIRPISSHNFKINDYASYRGMLILTGISNNKEAKLNEHIIFSKDKKSAIWAGAIDDLWKMGKPVGKGGPWVSNLVKKGEISDPYLFGFYDKRIMNLSHTSSKIISFTIEVDPTGDGTWFKYKDFTVQPHEKLVYEFPKSLNARWIRIIANDSTIATCWFDYV